jgi:hypothetical protein
MKQYTYYVGTFNFWTLVQADNAEEAIALAKPDPILQGRPILTVRVATKDEIDMQSAHLNFLCEEKSRALAQANDSRARGEGNK